MNLYHGLVLAAIQGLTEFLPVSSSAHLLLIPVLLGWETHDINFDIAIHLGTLCAVLIYFRSYIFTLCNPFNPLTIKLIIATIPAGVVGLLAKPYIEMYARDPYFSPLIIAASTIIFAFILGIAQYKEGKKFRSFAQIKYSHALLIGLFQCFALIPGASRSGVTISAALLLGLDRKTAIEFAFLISIPVIALSSLKFGVDLVKSGELASIDLTAYLLSFLVSAVIGTCAIYSFIKLLKTVGMYPFVLYRFILGGFLIYYFV